MNIKKYSDKIYKANTLKELKDILETFSNEIVEPLSKNTLLLDSVQESYIKTKSFGYRGKLNGEVFQKYYCPECKKMYKGPSYKPFFCEECDAALHQRTDENITLLLDKNIVMYGNISIIHKNFDKLKELEGDDAAYIKYMQEPSNFEYRINTGFQLLVFTKKHKFRIYKTDSRALLQFRRESGLNISENNPVKLDLFNKKEDFFDTIDDVFNVDREKTVFENIFHAYYYNKNTKSKRKTNIPKDVLQRIKRHQEDNYGATEFLYISLNEKTQKIDMEIYAIERRFGKEDKIIKRRLTNKLNNAHAVPLQTKEEIEEIISQTNYKFSGLDILIKNALGKYNILSSTGEIRELMNYQDLYDEKPDYEKIIKHPVLSKLVDNALYLKEYKNIIKPGKSINEVFDLSPEVFNVLENIVKNTVGIYSEEIISEIIMLKEYQNYIEENKEHSTEYLDYLFFIVRYRDTSMEKITNMIINYGLKEKEIYNYLIRNYNKYLLPIRTTLDYWYDYLIMAKELKYNFSNKSLLFPEDVILAHDNASYAYNLLVKEFQEELFQDKMKKLQEKYLYSDDDYAIVVPGKTSDIVEEGATLRHCVKSYIDRVIKGKTEIVFIRESKNLEKPFYTMEIKNNKVVQIRGFSNKIVTPNSELDHFINKFKEEKNLY